MSDKVDLKKQECLDGLNYLLCVDIIPGRINRFFGALERGEEYFGNGTTWYRVPDKVRCEPGLERKLSGFYVEIKRQEGIRWALEIIGIKDNRQV